MSFFLFYCELTHLKIFHFNFIECPKNVEEKKCRFKPTHQHANSKLQYLPNKSFSSYEL